MGVEHLGLRRIQVLHGMCVRIPRRHTPHEGRSIDLLAWARYSHVPDELVRHAAGGRARLAWVVRHTLSHRMAWGTSWVLLHPARMRRKTWCHTSHHLQSWRVIHRVDVD